MKEEPHAGQAVPDGVVRVGAFELDLRAGELSKGGRKIRLQEQPFQIFLMLLERPGDVVLREEIRSRLWPNDTFVQFAPSINTAIQRLREALGDSADTPRYVETVGRRGYRLREKVTATRGLEPRAADANLPRSSSSISPTERRPGKVLTSIAVFPFANTTGDPDADYLSEGITENIINSLSEIAGLRVMPRSSVLRNRAKDLDSEAIGRELKVGVVLAGEVRLRDETLVVSAELVDVADGSQVWGERNDRRATDIFDVQDEIARKIAESLRLKLSGKQHEHLTKRFTESSEAYQLYLRGRHHWSKRRPESIKRGCEYFQKASRRIQATHWPTLAWPIATGSCALPLPLFRRRKDGPGRRRVRPLQSRSIRI